MSPRKSKTPPQTSEADHFASRVAVGREAGAGSVAPGHILRVGPAGWSYPDWAGYVYPSRRARGFHEATYLAEFFDTIEINTSFYQPLRPNHAAQ
jgi:hypothetical protein